MKKFISALSLFTVIFFSFLSCSQPQEKKTASLPPVIPDSLFRMKNMPNTMPMFNFWYDPDDNYSCYQDSTKKIKFVRLDSAQKEKYLLPVMGDVDKHYVISYVDAYFISKQDTMNGFTPIIIKASGDDYDEMMMLLLDKKGNVASKLSLSGGECGGPDEIGDSLMLNCPYLFSTMKNGEVDSYVLHVYDRESKDNITRPSIIDSVTFISKITGDGKFETKKKDSTRYERVYKWQND
ncbi:MAG: hypothetical protein HY064_01595 [Bacteroidetes bacterium]|nr:hypothetical protein [Bacteroidota bacterium]